MGNSFLLESMITNEKKRKNTHGFIDILYKTFYNVGYNAIVRRSVPIWENKLDYEKT